MLDLTKKFMQEVFDYDDIEGQTDEETVKEIGAVNDAITVSLDRQNQLSNGDTVALAVEINPTDVWLHLVNKQPKQIPHSNNEWGDSYLTFIWERLLCLFCIRYKSLLH